MDFLTCVYCKKRFPATGGLRKNGGLDYCSTSCYYAYNDRKEEREKSERRQLEAEQERTEAVREQTASARKNAQLQAAAENNRAAAERQRAAAEKARAAAEREKARAIKEQTEYLKKQHEEDVKKQERKERLDALNEKCSKIYTTKDGKITYRMGHRPMDEFDCKKSSVFFDDFKRYRAQALDILGGDFYFAKPNFLVNGRRVNTSSETKFSDAISSIFSCCLSSSSFNAL